MCTDLSYLDFLQLSAASTESGLHGRVIHEPKPSESNVPLAGVAITLRCENRAICATTTTNSNGEFSFLKLRPGNYWISSASPGFYEINQLWYRAHKGFDAFYLPIVMERCLNGDCDPKLRPVKIN